MSVSSETDKVCCQVLNEYLFDKVWNEPSSEYRTNVTPSLLTPTSVVGSLSLADGNLQLPTSTRSYIYAIGTDAIPVGQKLSRNTWYSGVQICNDFQMMLNLCTKDGAMLHKGSFYIYLNSSATTLFLAVSKPMFKKCSPDCKPEDLILAFYYDSDHNTSSTFEMASVAVTTFVYQDYYTAINKVLDTVTDFDQVLIYKNGELIKTGATGGVTLAVGDYVDYIVDRNIEYTFTLQIANESDDPVYFSETDKQYKQIIHIPKACNPDQSVITHNTCDFFVLRKETEEGLYLQRANTEVTQITHNDMSINIDTLDAYRDYLAEQVIAIKVVVRKHNKDNVLIRDSNFIDLLYSENHSDEDIISILSGSKTPGEITWWTANHLEQSEYVKMMFDTPNVITLDNMQAYVDALGFYHVIELLCQRVIDALVTDATGNTITLHMPALYAGKSVTAIMYVDGVYVPRDYYTSSSSGQTIEVNISDSYNLQIGQKLTFVLFLTQDNDIRTFTLASDCMTVEVPFATSNVYVKKTLDTNYPGKGVNTTSQYSYTKLELGKNQYIVTPTGTGSKITFSADYVNCDVVIENTYCAYLQTHNLEPYTTTGKPIAVPLYSSVYHHASVEPILEIPNILVYLNQAYLVKDIDYTVNKVVDRKGDLCFYEIVVQAMDYFNESGADLLDIIVNMAEEVDRSNGFVVEDIAQDKTPVNLNYSNISITHVDGRIERHAEFRGTYLKFEEGKYETGSAYEIQTSVPALVSDYVAANASSEEDARLAILNDYFYQYNKSNPETVYITKKHNVYSPYMSKFILDYLSGAIEVPDEPDVNRINDYIKPYDYIKTIDVCYTYPDNTYLEYYPQYVNYTVTPKQKHLIDKYISLYMPKNYAESLNAVYSSGENK